MSEQPQSPPTLARAMGLGMAIAVVVGNVIGSGIFAKPGGIAADAGDLRVIMTSWVVGGVLSLMGALCVAELAAMLPQAGGLYVYLREAYGKLPAFLFGWSEFLFHRPASTGALSIMCVINFGKALNWGVSPVEQVMMASVVITALCVVNVVGVLWGGWLQAVTTLFKCGFIVLIIVLPFLMGATGQHPIEWSNLSTSTTPAQPDLATQFAAVLLAVSWAYDGWHGITPVAEEIKDPQRNVPLALFIGIGILAFLYISANVAYHLVIPMAVMAEPDNQKHVATLTLKALLGPIGQTMMAVGIMVSTLGAINSNLLYGPRVSFAMGRDQVFFPQLGRVHPRFRTPAMAIAVQAAMSIVMAVASLLLSLFVPYFQGKSLFDMLTDYIVFSASIFYVSAVLAVIVLRKTQPQLQRPYRTLGYPVVPALYGIFYAWFLFQIFRAKPGEAVIGLGLIAIGWPAYLWWSRVTPIRQPGP